MCLLHGPRRCSRRLRPVSIAAHSRCRLEWGRIGESFVKMAPELTVDADENPLVSVIVPFLNGAKFIREAIESVFSQTYQNWELILVDDGSTDSSSGIARQYAELHPGRVRYLEHEGHQNRGQAPARNLGIRHAAGEFFAFLDCDDIWLPH